ncbi:hypothetical protein M9458_025813, partial [Cirrhinus mrigala]
MASAIMQALLEMRDDQELCFRALVQAQQENRELFQSWIDQVVWVCSRSVIKKKKKPSHPTHVPLNKMGPQGDPETFIDLFEKSAKEAQVAAQQLPMQNLLVFADLKRAILQRVGLSPEEHRQRMDLGKSGPS